MQFDELAFRLGEILEEDLVGEVVTVADIALDDSDDGHIVGHGVAVLAAGSVTVAVAESLVLRSQQLSLFKHDFFLQTPEP